MEGLSYTSTGAQIQAHAFAYRRSADQDAATPARHAVVVVGAGPVGLSLAIDLAQRGQRVLLLANHIGSQTDLLEALQAASHSGRKEATPS